MGRTLTPIVLTDDERKLVQSVETDIRKFIRWYCCSLKVCSIPKWIEDAEQHALARVCRCARTYDPSRGEFRFYAIASAKGSILHWIRDFGDTLKTPRGKQHVAVYLDSEIIGTSEEGNGHSLEDNIAQSQEDSSPFASDDWLAIKYIVSRMEKDLQDIFHWHFEMEISQEEIGAIIGRNQMYVSRKIKLIKDIIRRNHTLGGNA